MPQVKNRIIRRRLMGAWLSSIVSICLVLLLVGVASLLLVNARRLSDYFKEHMQISVILRDDVEDSKALDVKEKLDAMPWVHATEYISREQGTEELEEMLGEDFLTVFESSPVPVSFNVSLDAAYVSPDSVAMVKSQLEKVPEVDEVVYHESLIEALNGNLSKISLVIGVFIILLLFISFVLIGNTVRLNVHSRRFSIHTMQLVGATRGFIRGPFMVQAFFQGIFSAFLAILLLLGLLYFLRSEFEMLFEVFSLKMLLVVMGIVLVSGIVICMLSTYFVVNRLVTLSKDELYA
ncbi:MAG: ABC transporter permease [Bacteroidales bacterium]|nr:ABC transporter permease [Bacteroidales bacterium]